MPQNGSRHEDEALGGVGSGSSGSDSGADAGDRARSEGEALASERGVSDPAKTGSPRIRDMRVGRGDGSPDDLNVISNPFGPGFESEEVAALTKERDELLDALRRTQADFENYKKRIERQSAEVRDRANERIVERLLPPLDAFALARTHMGDAEGSAEVQVLLKAGGLFEEALQKEGLERIDAKEVTFDPTTHEAVEQVSDDTDGTAGGEKPTGPVVDEIYRPGYIWKGRVLRPAMVRVRG
jgi:molecular chaperone GrpE